MEFSDEVLKDVTPSLQQGVEDCFRTLINVQLAMGFLDAAIIKYNRSLTEPVATDKLDDLLDDMVNQSIEKGYLEKDFMYKLTICKGIARFLGGAVQNLPIKKTYTTSEKTYQEFYWSAIVNDIEQSGKVLRDLRDNVEQIETAMQTTYQAADEPNGPDGLNQWWDELNNQGQKLGHLTSRQIQELSFLRKLVAILKEGKF